MRRGISYLAGAEEVVSELPVYPYPIGDIGELERLLDNENQGSESLYPWLSLKSFFGYPHPNFLLPSLAQKCKNSVKEIVIFLIKKLLLTLHTTRNLKRIVITKFFVKNLSASSIFIKLIKFMFRKRIEDIKDS